MDQFNSSSHFVAAILFSSLCASGPVARLSWCHCLRFRCCIEVWFLVIWKLSLCSSSLVAAPLSCASGPVVCLSVVTALGSGVELRSVVFGVVLTPVDGLCAIRNPDTIFSGIASVEMSRLVAHLAPLVPLMSFGADLQNEVINLQTLFRVCMRSGVR